MLSNQEIKDLSARYRELEPINRMRQLYVDFELDEVMLTTSFAASSALLLKYISEVEPKQKIYFIDTRYHFKETLIYKEYLTKLYDLDVHEVRADEEDYLKTKKEHTWIQDANRCCAINKVNPLQGIAEQHKVWISGLMAWQSDHRSGLDIFERRQNLLKFYPLLDIAEQERHALISTHHLPFHPLVSKGYQSIGCEQCTVPGAGRSGRWNNNPKTECGLHL